MRMIKFVLWRRIT